MSLFQVMVQSLSEQARVLVPYYPLIYHEVWTKKLLNKDKILKNKPTRPLFSFILFTPEEDEMMATAIKRPGPGTIPPAAKKQRFDIKGGVRHFECIPASQIENAIQRAREQEGVVTAVRNMDQPGVISILFPDSRRFQKFTDCFDDENWTLQQIRGLRHVHFDVPLGFLPPSDFIRSLGLTELEEENLPVVDWIYSCYGKMIPLKDRKDIFVLFTFDTLMELGFYTQKNTAARAMNTFRATANCIFLRDYRELLGRRYLDDEEKCVIMNPLFYQPITPQVLVVRKGYTATVFSRCTSDKAKALSSLMGRVFDKLLEQVADKRVLEIGQKAFDEQASEYTWNLRKNLAKQKLLTLKAEKLLSDKDAEMARMEHKLKHSEMVEKLAIKDVELARKDAIIAETRLIRHKTVNKPIRTQYYTSDDFPKMGCVRLVLTQPLKDEPRGKTLIQMQFTEQRDFVQRRRTLRESATALKSKDEEECLLNLYGGTHVIRLRSVLGEVFQPVKPAQSKRFQSLFTADGKEDTAALVEQRLKDKIKDNFALGIVGGKKLLFANHDVIGSLPDDDRRFCHQLIDDIQ